MAVAYAGRGATTAIGGKWAGVSGLQSLTQTITLPASIAAGDLLVLMLTGWMKDTDSDGSFSGVPSGWLQITDITSAETRTYAGNGPNRLEMWVRVADGTETNFSITGGSSFHGLGLTGGAQTQWIGECYRFTRTAGESVQGVDTVDDGDQPSPPVDYPVNFPGGYFGKHVVLGMALTASTTGGTLTSVFTDHQSNTSRSYYALFGFVTDVAGGISTTFQATEFCEAVTFAIANASGGPWLGLRRG